MQRKFLLLLLACSFAVASTAADTKTLSGVLHTVKGKVITVQKIGLFSKSSNSIAIELDEATKTTGELAPGMHIKVKYREEGGRKIAVEIETKPEYASKEAKQAPVQPPK
jgi:hypothetical protein